MLQVISPVSVEQSLVDLRVKHYALHLPLHLGHLAEAFIRSDLQLVHWLEERQTTICYCRFKVT